MVASNMPTNKLNVKQPLKNFLNNFILLKFFNLINKIISDSLNDPIPKSGENEVIVLVAIKTPVLNIPRYLNDMPANMTEVKRLINWEILIQKLYFNDSLSKFRVSEKDFII